MFSPQQILDSSDDVGYAGDEEQVMLEEEIPVEQQEYMEEETGNTVEVGDSNELPVYQSGDIEEQEEALNVYQDQQGTSSFKEFEVEGNNEDDEPTVGGEYYEEELAYEDADQKYNIGLKSKSTFPAQTQSVNQGQTSLRMSGGGGGQRPVVVVRAPSGGGYVSISGPVRKQFVKVSSSEESQARSIGQYVMRGGQMVRIGSHPTSNVYSNVSGNRQNTTSSSGTFFTTTATGSPVKVVRIMSDGAKQKIGYQRIQGPPGQSFVTQQGPQPGQGSIVIKGDPKVPAYRGANQVQYVRLVQAGSSFQPKTIKPVPKPIMPFIPKPSVIGVGSETNFGVDPSSQDISSLAETPSVPPSTAVVVKKKPAVGNKKPCNCTKSMCLKLYCECFANGEFCRNCNCKECHNNMENEDERSKAIKSSLERNPNAFQPKIGKTGRSEVDRMHQKGCHCKKSSCLKNYCECYEAKVSCTIRCKCVGCRNTEQDRINKSIPKFSSSTGLLHLANAANTVKNDLSRSNSPAFSEPTNEQRDPKTMPWYYMTDEVVECTSLCLVAQAEELERTGVADEGEMEKAILKEFGRCLEQIIHNAAAASSSNC